MIESNMIPAHDRQPVETRYPNKGEYEQRTKRRNYKRGRVTFLEQSLKAQQVQTMTPQYHQQDAVMQQYQHQPHQMEQQAQQQRV